MQKTVLSFAIPVLVTNLLMGLVTLFSLNITASHSKVLTAAFALGNNLYLVYIGFLAGITAATISYFASSKTDEAEGLAKSLICGIILTTPILLFFPFCQQIYYHLAKASINIYTQTDLYLSIIKWVLPFATLNYSLSAYLIFKKKNWDLLKLNIQALVFSLLFLFIIRTYITSATLSIQMIALSLLLSSILLFILLLRYIHLYHIKFSALINSIPLSKISNGMDKIISNAFYSGGQIFLLVSSLAILLTLSAQINTESVSVMAALLTINRLFILPSKSFGTAVGALAAKEYSQDNYEQGNKLLVAGIKVLSYFIIPIAALMIIKPALILNYFCPKSTLVSSSYSAVRVAGLALMFEPLAGFLSNALKTQGMAKLIFISTLYQWLVTIPLSWYFGVHQSYGIIAIWLSILSFRVLLALSCIIIWKKNFTTAHYKIYDTKSK
jgi:Na+-driven multidrug efflux pump